MSEKLIKAMDKFYHDMSIADLQYAYKTREVGSLSYHDTLYLNIIESHPNRYTSSQIADLLKITRPAVTQKISELTKKGYIIKTQSATDKRVFYLATNPKKSFYTEENKAAELKISKLLEDKYGKENVDKMCEMLEFLAESLFNEKVNRK